MPNIHAPNEADRKLVEQANRIVERMRDFRLPYDSMRNELHRQFIGAVTPRFYPDGKTRRSSNSVPYAYTNVNQVVATLYEVFFSTDPCFETLPRGSRDTQSALNMQRVLDMKLFGEARLRSAISEYLIGLAVYGFGAISCDWDFGYDVVPSHEDQPVTDSNGGMLVYPGTDMPMTQRVSVDKKLPRSRPLIENIDIFDFLVDPDGTYCARSYTRTLPELIREAEVNPDLYDPATLEVIANELSRDPINMADALIRIIALWDAKEGNCVLLTAPEDSHTLTYKDSRYGHRAVASTQAYTRKVAQIPTMLLRAPYQPFLHRRLPLLWSHYTKLPGEIYGMGVVEPTYHLIESLNRFTNLITDNWDLTVNQRLVVNDTGDLDFGQLQKNNVPGGIIRIAGDVNTNFTTFPMHTPDQGSYAIIPLYRQMIESGASVSDFYDRGIGSSGGNSTATGISAVAQQTAKTKMIVARRVNEDIITPILQLSSANCQQFLNDEIEMRITDEAPAIPKIDSQFVRIAPEDLRGNFDFRMVGPTYMENRHVQAAGYERFLQISAASPALAQFIKPHPMLLEGARLHNLPYPHRLLYTEEEVAQIQQQQMEQQMAQQTAMMAVEAQLAQETGAAVDVSKAANGPKKNGPDKNGGRVGPARTSVAAQTRNFAQLNGANARTGGGPANVPPTSM